MSVGCLTSQQHASVSQERTATEVDDKTFYLTQSQYTDSPSSDPTNAKRLAGQQLEYNFCLFVLFCVVLFCFVFLV